MTDDSFALEPELAVGCRREGWQRNYKVAFRRRRLITSQHVVPVDPHLATVTSPPVSGSPHVVGTSRPITR
jgi:hypothetical protein